MADDQPIICVLCLDVDQRDAMLHVRLENPRSVQRAEYYICRPCAYTIAEFLREAGELPPIKEEEDS